MKTEEVGQMPETELAERVEQLFASALAQTYQREALADVHHAVQQGWRRLKQPMRVAIIGLIKAGKSTMMNALLGETVVATGVVEATFNVNWLKYDTASSLLVHFKNERPPEQKSLADLERLTRRAEENRAFLLSIKYIEVFYPNTFLQAFNLIDTPGLASFYKDDSQNTLEFLKLHGQELTEATQREASNADAILYLFSHSLGAEGKELVELFQGPQIGQTTPINSLGVLTKVDAVWPSHPDALEAGDQIIETLQTDHPQLRRTFYTITPVSGSLAWGAQTMTKEEFATLQQLAQLPEALLEKRLGNAHSFATREYQDMPIPPEKREEVLDRLGTYGIWQAYQILRPRKPDQVHMELEEPDQAHLEQALLQKSGLPVLKQLILTHFGNRAYLIKLDSALQQIRIACFWARYNKSLSPADQEIVRQIESRFGQLGDQERGFSELSVLRDFYQGKLELTEEEVEQLLQITGEYGLSERLRLGLPEKCGGSSAENRQEILDTANKRRSYWRRRALDPGASREMIQAASILGDTYNHISYQAMKQFKQSMG
jgi:GTPase SAR1 family protein